MKREKVVYFGKRKALIFAFLFATLIFVCFGDASGTTHTAFFTYTPRYPGVNHPITFDASICYDPEGCITNYEWDFGDGNRTNTTEKIITHSYALEGDYSVNLTVTDNDGAKKSTSKEVTVLMSPSPEEEWSKTFGGTAFDRAYSVQQTADGGYILAGGMGAYGPCICDIWLVKTDSSGNEQWNKTFGDTDIDSAAEAVQQTTDGGYILAGGTRSYASGDYDVWLIKVKGEPAEPTGELTEQPVPIPGFKISGLLLGLILSVALATLKKMKNR